MKVGMKSEIFFFGLFLPFFNSSFGIICVSMDEKYNSTQNNDQMSSLDSNNLSEEEVENRISSEFDMLKDRCQKIFDGLRDIPNFGNWNPYFQRSFELYHEVKSVFDN